MKLNINFPQATAHKITRIQAQTHQDIAAILETAIDEYYQKIQDTPPLPVKPRQKGSAKGKLIIHSEDNEHLEAFQDYMPQ
jgi:hypothetical protein